jgi:hypothetical protein
MFSETVISGKATFPKRKPVPHKHPARAREKAANSGRLRSFMLRFDSSQGLSIGKMSVGVFEMPTQAKAQQVIRTNGNRSLPSR